MKTEVTKEHEWLQQFVGEWTYEGDAIMGGRTEQFRGTESARSLGGLWIVAESRGRLPDGGDATMILTLGHDKNRDRYVGTWIGSMMGHLWVYEGQLDGAGRVLTLESRGPDMSGSGGLIRYRDVYAFENRDLRILTAYYEDREGQWQQMMSATYRRTR